MKLNLTPDIDWTKEDVILYTNSGVKHYRVDQDKLSKHPVTIGYKCYKRPLYVSVKDNYLSFKMYEYYWKLSYSVSSFKSLPEQDAHLLTPQTYLYCYPAVKALAEAEHAIDLKIIDREVRVYHNRKVVDIIKAQFEDSNSNIISTKYVANAYSKNPVIISTDEEAEAAAVVLSKAQASTYFYMLAQNSYIGDLRNGGYLWGSYAQGTSFVKETEDILKNFFNLDAPENALIKEAYLNIINRTQVRIRDMIDLKNLLTAREAANKQEATKKERILELLPHFQDVFDNLELISNTNQAHWFRIGDDIVLLYRGFDDGYRYSGRNHNKAVFVYNVKTKKRLYGEYSGYWSFGVPSYSRILRTCNLKSEDQVYTYNLGKTEIHLQQTIHCDGGVKELFAGTNVAYVLENATWEPIVTSWNTCYSSAGTIEYIDNLINDDYIGNIVYAILFSTGIPVLEQFLKSKLFNLYFKAIENDDSNSWLCPNTQKITSKLDDGYKTPEKAAAWDTELEYLSRQKNLKKMFNMTMDQLRYLDQSYKLIDTTKSIYVYSAGCYQDTVVKERPQIFLYGAEKFFNKNLCDIDFNTFKEIVDHLRSEQNTRRGFKFADCLQNQYIYQMLQNLSIKQRLQILKDIKECDISIYEINDYFVMRGKLQLIQQRLPDIKIWDEKEYPVIPRASRRFVRYQEGVEDPIIHREMDPDNLVISYKNKFITASKRGDVTPIYEGLKIYGKLVGISLNLRAIEMIKYLHEELSYWISFYEDSSKTSEFTEAVKRVQSLEWKDEKSGLEIIAPKTIGDMKREGNVLSHCVATYTDSIIAGKENIMFLRRSDMIDQPFYTVEILNDGQIRQVHCYQNGDLTKEGQEKAYENSQSAVYNKTFNIVQFLLDWAKAKKGKVKSSSIQSRYGALCALR